MLPSWLRAPLGLTCWLLLASGLQAETPAAAPDDVAVLAARIDQLIRTGYAARQATPAPPADDAEFARRVYLDLAGRIPRVAEVRDFLEDRSPGKRRALVDRLLAGPQYLNHFATVWRDLLLPPDNDQRALYLGPRIKTWVRQRLRDNVPYDQMVRDLLTANVVSAGQPGAPFDVGAWAFYQANDFKPEKLAAATSRLFLGVKLECAQCHNHPFARWTRKQFWQYAAFFGGLSPQRVGRGFFSPPRDDPAVHTIQVPGSGLTVRAQFLDGAAPRWQDRAGARATLAEWLTRDDNPYFARAAANRLWAHFFGLGLTDPVDDARPENPPSHPELLDELARQLVAHHFDLKFLVRSITASRTYQLSSTLTHPSQANPRIFARLATKGLTPEQVFNNLATATGYREDQDHPEQVVFGRPPGLRQELLARFADPSERRTEQQTSVLQALALMNGKLVADATSLDRSETLAAVLDSPFLDDRGRLETLFLATLSRRMRPEEESRLLPYVRRGGPRRDPRKALADVFWALLNSSEFIVNH